MGSPTTGQPEASIAVVVPMYNEEQGAERCARAISAALEALPNRTALIVVNDGSRDGTAAILTRLAREVSRLVVVTHERNLGYGRAVQTGATVAVNLGFDYALFMDSDLTNDPRYLPAFTDKMRQGCEVIKASRYVEGGAVFGVPAWRRLISRVGNWVARLLFGLPVADCTNGFRAVKTAVLRQMRLHEPGFAVIMEELYQAKFLACKFGEVPYTLSARMESLRPSAFVYRPRVFFDYLKYAVLAAANRAPRHLRRREDSP